MRSRSFGMISLGAVWAMTLLVGCGDGTDVAVAKVPPVTPEPAKPTKAFPRKASHSPAILPGSESP